jgi:hypothetical protein
VRSGVLVYLAGPITAKDGVSVEQNVASALAVYFDCVRRGIPAFCPQLTAAFPSAFAIDYETWMAYDFAVLDRCTHLLLLPRWDTSAGAQREMVRAAERKLPIFTDLDSLESFLLRSRGDYDECRVGNLT